MSMMHRLVFAAALAFIASACGSDGGSSSPVTTGASTTFPTIPVTTPPTVPEALVGSWIVVSADGGDAPDGVTITISGGGGVDGFLGCNTMFGTITTPDGELHFVDVAYTEIACEGADDFLPLVDALAEVTSVQFSNGDTTASLSSADGVVVILERTDDIGPA